VGRAQTTVFEEDARARKRLREMIFASKTGLALATEFLPGLAK